MGRSTKISTQMYARKKKNKKQTSGKRESTSGSHLVSSGSTLLNLALSGSVWGAYGLGTMVNMIGDSSAGKSMEGLTLLAECANDSFFDDYDLVYDDVEHSNEFDMSYLFGKKAAERVQPPGYEKDDPDEARYSDTVEDFESFIKARKREGKKFIYILDSFDALTSEDELELAEKNAKAHELGNKTKGSYGMGKPKFASRFFRTMKKQLKNTESLLVIVSQTRANINPMSFSTKTRSGGTALDFYAAQIFWMAVIKKLKDNKYKRTLGVRTRCKVSKSKLTGKIREADFTIHYDYGIDDLDSCVDFLITYKFWPRTGTKVNARGLKFTGTKKQLIQFLENDPKQINKMKEIMQEAWDSIESELRLDRRRKYE